MIVHLSSEQISQLKDVIIYQRRLPQTTPQIREKLYLLYEALNNATPHVQYDYMVVNCGTLLEIRKEIKSYADRGWEAISHSSCSENHNYTVLLRKETK